MKKIAYLFLLLFVTIILSSCVGQSQCSAYGEKQRYQRNTSSWAR